MLPCSVLRARMLNICSSSSQGPDLHVQEPTPAVSAFYKQYAKIYFKNLNTYVISKLLGFLNTYVSLLILLHIGGQIVLILFS